MKLALDPWMIRDRSLTDICRFASETGYAWIELSPRDDFLPLLTQPRAGSEAVTELQEALARFHLGLASMWTVYRWSEPRDTAARKAAVGFWKQTIETAARLGCDHLNSEFSGDPESAESSERAFRESIEEILPYLEREKMTMSIEPHPGDFVEEGERAVEILRSFNSPHVRYLYCAPHTFHMGGDMAEMIRSASPLLAHVHVADTFDHRRPVRYIVNPPGSAVRIHQHLNIGEGEIDWDLFFRALSEIKYDGILTNSVFAWADKAEESARLMLEKINHYLEKYPIDQVRATYETHRQPHDLPPLPAGTRPEAHGEIRLSATGTLAGPD